MSQPRVLHLVPSFVGGGAERQLAYLAAAQADLGLDTHVGYVSGGPNLDLLSVSGVHLHELPSAGNHDPLLLLRLLKLIRATEPSVVQTWLRQMDVMGGLAARLSGVPWILSERASAEHYRGWKNGLRKRLARGAAAIAANSDVGLAYWGHLAAKRVTIRNIVPLQAIAEAPAVVPAQADALTGVEDLVLAAGRLEPQKNWFVLVEAIDLALRSRPAAHAVLFGEGYMRHEIATKISSLSCGSRIHLRGYSSVLWGWLKRASVYLSVSHFEGTPNVVLEALACGCPLVLSDIPSHREIVTADEADLVPTASPAAIARGIDRALSRGRSPSNDLRAMERLQAWSAARIAEEYCALYRELLDGDRPQPAVERSESRS